MLPLAQVGEVVAGSANSAEVILLGLFGLIAIGSAVAVISMRKVVHAALMLVVNLLSVAGIYLVMQSPFLSVVQVIVYAGAIVVLFLFVIMLLGVDRDDLLGGQARWHLGGALAGAIALATLLIAGFIGPYTSGASRCGGQADRGAVAASGPVVRCVGLDDITVNDQPATSVEFIADRLFTRFTFPFEAAGLLLVVATIGAIVLGRRTDVPADEDPAYEPSGALPPDDLADDQDEQTDDLANLILGRSEPASEDPLVRGEGD